MNIETFIGHAIKEMISMGVSVEFTKRKRPGKFGYNYFYDGKHPKFGRRITFKINFYNDNLEDQYGIFLHEYCHFLQWKDGIPLWEETRRANSNFDNWIQNKTDKFDIEDLRIIQRLELDCDRRVINLIKEYNIPLDIEDYIAESNGYILSHNIMFKTREFYINDAYSSKDVTKFLPTYHIGEDELGLCPEEFEKAFLEKVNSQ